MTIRIVHEARAYTKRTENIRGCVFIFVDGMPRRNVFRSDSACHEHGQVAAVSILTAYAAIGTMATRSTTRQTRSSLRLRHTICRSACLYGTARDRIAPATATKRLSRSGPDGHRTVCRRFCCEPCRAVTMYAGILITIYVRPQSSNSFAPATPAACRSIQ
jgi:hypothetical protein